MAGGLAGSGCGRPVRLGDRRSRRRGLPERWAGLRVAARGCWATRIREPVACRRPSVECNMRQSPRRPLLLYRTSAARSHSQRREERPRQLPVPAPRRRRSCPLQAGGAGRSDRRAHGRRCPGECRWLRLAVRTSARGLWLCVPRPVATCHPEPPRVDVRPHRDPRFAIKLSDLRDSRTAGAPSGQPAALRRRVGKQHRPRRSARPDERGGRATN